MKTALVTGASGFVAGHLIPLLGQNGYVVDAFVRPRGGRTPDVSGVRDVFTGDLADSKSVFAAVATSAPDVIFHLGAQSHVGESFKLPTQTLRANGEGTLNLLEAVRNLCPNAVVQLASTSETYGQVEPDEIPIRETNRIDRPLSIYAISKVTTDLLGYFYARAYGLKIVRTRSFNAEGPGRPDAFAPSAFAAQIARIENGLQEPVIRHGNLDAVRDYTDVRDVAQAYVAAVERAPTDGREPFNIASGVGHKMSDVLQTLISMSPFGHKIRLEQDPARMRPSDVPRLIGDSTRFMAATGWTPKITFDQTLNDLLAWWRGRVAP